MHTCALISSAGQAGTALSPFDVLGALRGRCLFVEIKQNTDNGAAHCKCQRCVFRTVSVARSKGMLRKGTMVKAKPPLGDFRGEHSKENNVTALNPRDPVSK